MHIQSQVVLDHVVLSSSAQELDALWRDSLVIPAYVAAISAIFLLLHITLLSNTLQTVWDTLVPGYKTNRKANQPESGGHVAVHGGKTVFAYKVAKLAGCLAVTGLSIVTLRSVYRDIEPILLRAQLALCISTGYSCLLAFSAVAATPRFSRLAANHLALLLLVLLGVYVYRDIWPLATVTRQPADSLEGWFLWSKLVILAIISVMIPLVTPRQYTPLDPEEPCPPNPEQTASLISLVTYAFLDPTILLANRIPHLSADQLPPIADYDQAKNLVKKSFPTLDPFTGGNKHLFWGIVSVFRADYCVVIAMLILHVLGGLATPVGINQLLRYIESNGEDTNVRPCVWILWLLVWPILDGLSLQWHNFTATRMMIQAEGIITQLVYSHALRIRMKAELPYAVDNSLDNMAQEIDAGVKVTPAPSGEETLGQLDSTDSVQPKDTARINNLVGKINNLVTTDMQTITNGRDFLLPVIYIPLQVCLSITFLYYILGWSALVGLAVLLCLFPLPGYIASQLKGVHTEKMKAADARVQTTTETITMIRMIKLFGWEKKMQRKISSKRDDELRWIRTTKIFETIIDNLNFIIPCMTMTTTFGIFTFVMKQSLTSSIVFSSMTVFNILQEQLNLMLRIVPSAIKAKVSLDRVSDFLNNTELLDEFSETRESVCVVNRIGQHDIGIRNAVFSWSGVNNGASTPPERQFRLQIEDKVLFNPGQINLIVGPTGSGKTSLLMALLGEMHFTPSGPDSCFNLPRDGGVAYAAQESWVLNETIKENIIFGSTYNEKRYKKVIFQCGLSHDLELFEAGDQTEVGEKGLTLSGGQKARLTLARAVYSPAEILLLDDVLAALDVHTAKHIVEKCFSGDLIKGRTVILVTHNIALASPIANYVVSLGIDGRILSQGSVADALVLDKNLAVEADADQEVLDKAERQMDAQESTQKAAKKTDGKLIVEEDVAEGFVSWEACQLFFTGLGGNYPITFWIIILVGNFLVCFVAVGNAWWLGHWATQYDNQPPSEVTVPYYMAVYGLLLVIGPTMHTTSHTYYIFGTMRASKVIHENLIESVLGTTLRWLDKTPTSRIITRCTQDIAAVDDTVPDWFIFLLEVSIIMIVRLAAVMIYTPVFLLPGIAVGLLGAVFGKLFGRAQLSVKRESSNARAPVLGHFEASITGLVSIRAYGAQAALKQESMVRIDKYTRAARTFQNLNRWIDIRSAILGAFFSSGLAAYLIYGSDTMPVASNTGFSLNMATSFSALIMYWVQLVNLFQVSANSLERIGAYTHGIEQEPKSSVGGTPPAYWPASGDIRVDNLSARYSADGPKVLHDISFHIKSGERIGIVGRTGSGKSSLTLSLLRCILTEGTVYYDGIPTHSLNLDALRSNISIIPQVPELLAGTLRQNLDPFGQYEDATLNDALRASGLYSLQVKTEEGRITLDSLISAGGSNLSVGQRQILALARAIVRGSKLLILDEATSAIDYETDNIIQSSLRNELGADITLLTVAHRLQTIMDSDRIMVLDAGRVAEFGRPHELLQIENGLLRALVDESGDRDELTTMAEGRGAP